MAVVTAGGLAQVAVWILGFGWPVLAWALWLVVALTAATVLRRSLTILKTLRA